MDARKSINDRAVAERELLDSLEQELRRKRSVNESAFGLRHVAMLWCLWLQLGIQRQRSSSERVPILTVTVQKPFKSKECNVNL
jgi:hypothetical protein